MKHFRFLLFGLIISNIMAFSNDDIQLLWENKFFNKPYEVKLSPTDNNLAVAVGDEGLFVINTLNGEIIKNLSFPDYGEVILKVEFMNDGETVAYGTSTTGKVVILNIISEEIISVIDLYDPDENYTSIGDLEFTPDKKYLMAATNYIYAINTSDWSIEQKWNDITYWQETPPKESLDQSTKITISYDGKYVAAYFIHNDIVAIYDLETIERIKIFSSEKWGITFANKSNILSFDYGRQFYDIDNDLLFETPIFTNNVFFASNDGYILALNSKKISYFNNDDFSLIKETAYKGFSDPPDIINEQYLLTKYLRLYDISNFTSVLDHTYELEIFPNPASEEIIISNIPVNAQRMEIIDLEGNVVETIETNLISKSIAYNVTHIVQGTYFIRLITDDISETYKFVIVK